MMTPKIGRNDPCPCGSGKKYKRCHGSGELAQVQINVPDRTAVAFFDADHERVVFITRDTVVNQLKREGPRIAESFDKAFGAEIQEISDQFGPTFGLLGYGFKVYLEKNPESVQVEAAQLLLNAAQTTISALELIRHGFRLQPGILIRNAIETICVALTLITNPLSLGQFRSGELKSSKTVTSAKKVIPILGDVYGHFSREFAHLGDLHRQLHSWDVFSADDEAADMNLRAVKLGINLITIATELLFYDLTPKHRYWERIQPNGYRYNPSEEEENWQQKFLLRGSDTAKS